ncbi:MAG: YbaN family protein [Pseudomonadota bacterium]
MTSHRPTETAAPGRQAPPPRLVRYALLALGHGCFAIGFAGLFVPGFPTTIFWIGAAYAYSRSDPALKARIYGWPRIGPIVEDFLDHGVMGRRAKVVSIAALAISATVLGLTRPPAFLFWPSLIVFGAIAWFLAIRPETRTAAAPS